MLLNRRAILFVPLIAVLVLTIAFSATLGFLQVSIPDVFTIIWTKLLGHGQPADLDPVAATVVADVRMPRILCSVLVGRITSYNVCYTKLLRSPRARYTIQPGGDQRKSPQR